MTNRPVKEFFSSFKRSSIMEGETPFSAKIIFLNWLIRNVKDDAMISERQEEELTKGIDWEWWSTEGKPSWYIFLNLSETLPQ